MEARQDKRLVQIFMKEKGTLKNSILDGGRVCRYCGDNVGWGGVGICSMRARGSTSKDSMSGFPGCISSRPC